MWPPSVLCKPGDSLGTHKKPTAQHPEANVGAAQGAGIAESAPAAEQTGLSHAGRTPVQVGGWSEQAAAVPICCCTHQDLDVDPLGVQLSPGGVRGGGGWLFEVPCSGESWPRHDGWALAQI